MLPIHVWNMEFLSQPDLKLYKFVKKHCESTWPKNHVLLIFAGVEIDNDVVCFIGKLY